MNEPHSHPLIAQMKTLLAGLPEDAMIAGGCLRDCLLGARPKDIDLFVGPDFDVSAWAEKNGGWASKHLRDSAEYETGMPGSVARVIDPTLFLGDDGLEHYKGISTSDGIPLQIIQMAAKTSTEQQLARFDFDFCQFALAQDGTFVGTDAAYVALGSKKARWRLAVGDSRRRGSEDRVRRWLGRPEFRDWRFVFPGVTYVYSPYWGNAAALVDKAS